MSTRGIVRGFCLSIAAVIGLTGAGQAASATPVTDTQRLAEAGSDVSRLPAGWSLVGDELWWEGGAIRTSIEPTNAAAAPCPTGYLCLYSDADLNGYRFASSWVGQPIFLTRYPMDSNRTWNDQVSSWVNLRGFDARWWYHTDNPTPVRCMNPGSRVEHMGADNDQMSSFYIHNSSTVCS